MDSALLGNPAASAARDNRPNSASADEPTMFGVGLSFGGSRAPMNDLIPATGERHNEANMSVIDR